MAPVDLQPGDFCVCSMDGQVGMLVGAGEWFDELGIDREKDVAGHPLDEYRHAFVYVGDGYIVQAQPGGAIKIKYAPKRIELWSTGLLTPSPKQRSVITTWATQLAGEEVRYSFLDYWALAAHRLHIPVPFLEDFIASNGHLICSQLVDYCWLQAGFHLFTDGRWPGFVAPWDLALRLQEAM